MFVFPSSIAPASNKNNREDQNDFMIIEVEVMQHIDRIIEEILLEIGFIEEMRTS